MGKRRRGVWRANSCYPVDSVSTKPQYFFNVSTLQSRCRDRDHPKYVIHSLVSYHAFPTLLTCPQDDHLHEPESSQGESRFGDSSAPLFTMYSKIAEEEDNKMIERWQKDSEGIIIFVRNIRFRAVVRTNCGLCRLVYSLLSSLQRSLYQFRTLDPTHRILPRSISRKCISSRLTPMHLARPLHPL